MSPQGQTFIYKAISTLVVVLAFLADEIESTELSDNNYPTNVPGLPNITALVNRSFEEPHVLRMYKPCKGANDKFCENGGKCFIPQDTETPSCICPTGYIGERCVHYTAKSAQTDNCEKLIGVGVGVALLVCCLALTLYCCVYRRCNKPSPPYKVYGSENSV